MKNIRQFMFLDMNAPDLPQGPLANLSLQQRRRYPQWGTLGTWSPIGWSKYNGLNVSIKNNEWHGLTLIAYYAFSKNISSSHWRFSDQGNEILPLPIHYAGRYLSAPFHRVYRAFPTGFPSGTAKPSSRSHVYPVSNLWLAIERHCHILNGSPQWCNGRSFGYGAYSGIALTAFAMR